MSFFDGSSTRNSDLDWIKNQKAEKVVMRIHHVDQMKLMVNQKESLPLVLITPESRNLKGFFERFRTISLDQTNGFEEFQRLLWGTKMIFRDKLESAVRDQIIFCDPHTVPPARVLKKRISDLRNQKGSNPERDLAIDRILVLHTLITLIQLLESSVIVAKRHLDQIFSESYGRPVRRGFFIF